MSIEMDDSTEPGIIYLSYIPGFMRVNRIREYFAHFGPVNRIYLEPGTASVTKKKGKDGSVKKSKSKRYVEGWVEFVDKRTAKRVALLLNNAPVGGPKRCPYRDSLWNIKYLSKFKWHQLRGSVESSSLQLRSDIAQAKKEVDFYKKNAYNSQKLQKIKSRLEKQKKEFVPRKRNIVHKKRKSELKDGVEVGPELNSVGESVGQDMTFLSSIFTAKG